MKGKGNTAKRRSMDILWYIPLVAFVLATLALNFN